MTVQALGRFRDADPGGGAPGDVYADGVNTRTVTADAGLEPVDGSEALAALTAAAAELEAQQQPPGPTRPRWPR